MEFGARAVGQLEDVDSDSRESGAGKKETVCDRHCDSRDTHLPHSHGFGRARSQGGGGGKTRCDGGIERSALMGEGAGGGGDEVEIPDSEEEEASPDVVCIDD